MILYCNVMCAVVCGQWGALKRLKGLGIRAEERCDCPALRGADESQEKDMRIFLGLIRATAALVAGPFCSERGCWLVAVAIRRTADAQLGG